MEALSISALELFTYECGLLCHPLPIVQAHKIQSCWHCPWPHLNCECWQLARVSFRLYFHKATNSGPLKRGLWTRVVVRHLGPTVGARELAPVLTRLSPEVYVPTKPTATKARPAPATGPSTVLSDTSQTLNLQNWWLSCKFLVQATMKRGFSSAS